MTAPIAVAADRWPDRVALIDGPVDLTYRQLARRAVHAASSLAEAGVEPGAIVGLLGFNSHAYVTAYLALTLLGATGLPLNLRLADPELRWQLEHAKVRLVVAASEFAERNLGAMTMGLDSLSLDADDGDPPTKLIVGCNSTEASWTATGYPSSRRTPGSIPEPIRDLDPGVRRDDGSDCHGTANFDASGRTWNPDQAASVFFTSGTTGKPKGVVLTGQQHVASAQAMCERLGLSSADRWLACMPLFHVGGLAIVHRMLACGGAVALLPKFTPDLLASEIERLRPTRVSLTASMLRHLLASGNGIADCIRTVLLGGEATPPDLLEACPQALASYGMTEAGSTVAIADPGTTHMRALPGFDIRILDADGRDSAQGEVGRIALRGPALMRGYLGRSPLDGDWHHTGDLGIWCSDGSFDVLARREDLILSGGENVYPAEVEAILLGHRAVAAAAVTGVADDRWGQVPAAAVVLRDPTCEPADLERHLRLHLAGYKIPKRWQVVAQLPTLPSGKLDRSAVRTLFIS